MPRGTFKTGFLIRLSVAAAILIAILNLQDRNSLLLHKFEKIYDKFHGISSFRMVGPAAKVPTFPDCTEAFLLKQHLHAALIYSVIFFFFWIMSNFGLLIPRRKGLSIEISLWLATIQTLFSLVITKDLLSSPDFIKLFAPLALLYASCLFAWSVLLIFSIIRNLHIRENENLILLMKMSLSAGLPLKNNGLPDWNNIQSDIPCPMCSYNLRELRFPRCPECGYPFKWTEIRPTPAPWVSRFFEYAGQGLIRSFFTTVFSSLLSARFFSRLTASHPINKRRLVALFLLLTLPLWLLQFLGPAVYLFNRLVAQRKTSTPAPLAGFLSEAINNYSHLTPIYPLFVAGWILFSFFSIFLLQETARKANFNNWQIIQCAIYSATPLPFFSVIYLLIVNRYIHDCQYHADKVAVITLALYLLLLWPILNLTRAARYYLRIPHPEFTVLLLQLAYFLIFFEFVYDFLYP